MSNKQTEVTMNEIVVTNKLAAKVYKVLKLDDASKIENFLSREVKSQQRAIDALEMERATATLQLKGELSEVEDNIQDATVAVEEAYEAITVGDIKSNESMTTFSAKYWFNIKSKEDALALLIKNKDKIQEAFDKKIEVLDDQIAKRKERIAKIS